MSRYSSSTLGWNFIVLPTIALAEDSEVDCCSAHLVGLGLCPGMSAPCWWREEYLGRISELDPSSGSAKSPWKRSYSNTGTAAARIAKASPEEWLVQPYLKCRLKA